MRNFIKQDKRHIIVLVLIVLIALVFSINKKERDTASKIDTKNLSASISASSNDIESSKDLKDEFLSFKNDLYSFNYPRGGMVDHYASSIYPNTRVFYFGKKQKVKDLSVFSSNKLYDGYGILVYNLGKKDAELVAKKEREAHIKECGISKISNLKNLSFAGKNSFTFNAKGCKGNFSIYYLNNDGGVLIKVVSYYIGDESYKEKLDEILKTFTLK